MSVKQISKILIKNGLSENLPSSLSLGEMAFTKDTAEVFIGAPDLPRIQYRVPTDGTSPIYPYKNVKILTEFDMPKAVTSDYYTQGPLIRFSLPLVDTMTEVHAFDSEIDTVVANYSLYSIKDSSTIFAGTLRIAGSTIYGDMYTGVNFSASYANNVITLSATNGTDSILTMNVTAQTWLSLGQTNA